MNLSNPSNVSIGDGQGSGTIIDDDTPPDTTGPTIISDSCVLAADNSYIDIVFSEGVYGAADGSTPLVSSQLGFGFSPNVGGTAGTVSLFGPVKKTDGTDLTGGETIVRLFLGFTGTPNGLEEIEITLGHLAHIYDLSGNEMLNTATTGKMALKDLVPPTVYTKPSFLVNSSNKNNGFIVLAQGSEGTLYVVPSGTDRNIDAIAGAKIGEAESVYATYVQIEISANHEGVVDGMEYRVYAVDEAGNISAISGVAFTADLTPPTKPTAVSVMPVGGTVIENTLNSSNTNMTATATITAGDATGGKADLYIQFNSTTEKKLATDDEISSDDTQVIFDLGKTSNAELRVAVESGGTVKVKLYDKAGNAQIFSEGNPVLTVDYENPSPENVSPLDNATNIDINTDLVITFNENIAIGTGNIVIKKAMNDDIIETIDVTSEQVTGNGTSTITINPSVALYSNTEYYVLIDATALYDISGNSFIGVASTTDWSFTTNEEPIEDITAASVNITAPVLGEAPQNAAAVQDATNHADYTVTGLVWNEPFTAGGKFKAGQVYTATVTLTSKNGKKFQAVAFTPTAADSESVGTTTTSGGDVVGNTVSFTVTYPATGALEVSSIAVTTQPTKMSYRESTDSVLALNGMQVTETNNDGSTNVVTFTDGTAVGYTTNPVNGSTLTNATHNGNPVVITHTASGKTSYTNNLTVNTAPIYGSLSFSSITYSVAENGVGVIITVNRTGGSDGSVTVDYQTSDGTATSGSDYTGTSGILTFNDGETSKTLTVNISDDTNYEENETVTLTLSNPTGGAVLGEPSSAELTIIDNEEPITEITAVSIQITAPVLGVVPQNASAVEASTAHADYTVTDLVWNEALTAGGKFKAGQVYTATVTLTSKNSKKFQAAAFTPTVEGSSSVGTTTTSGGDVVGNTVSFTITFAATGNGSGGGSGNSTPVPPAPAPVITISEVKSELFDNAEDIKVEADVTSAFGQSVEVKITDSTESQNEIFSLAGVDDKIYPFDISLYSKESSQKVQPKDGYSVKITLPVPEKLLEDREQIKVVFGKDGKLQTLKSELIEKDGKWYIVFEALHFSPYALIVSTEPAVSWTNPFNDVAEGSWYYSAVEYVAQNGLMLGTGSNTFSPGITTNRGMIATILYRLNGSVETSESTFKDVIPGAYYANAVAWAQDKGIIAGYGNGMFGPEDSITREQMATILWRYAGSPLATDSTGLDTFKDAGEISSYAKNALAWIYEKGIITGKGNGILDPKGYATRAEVARIMYNFSQKSALKE